MQTRLSLKIALVFFLLLFFIKPLSAIEYGGLGGKPAYPISENERSKSIFIYNLEPGTSKEDGVLVINNTEETKEIIVYSTDSEKSSDGSFACKQYSEPKDGVGKWLDLEEELILESYQTKVIDFTINVPDNASVGEENGCILIQEKELNSTESGVSLSFRTGLRVAVTIPGEQVRELIFNSLEAGQKPDGIITAKIDIENKGNVSIDTNIRVRSSYLFGIIANEVNNEYPIFRGEVSTFNFELPRPFWGGFITVLAEAEYDSSDQASIGIDSSSPKTLINGGSYTLFSFPELGALVIELCILLIIFGLIAFLYRKKRFKSLVKETWRDYVVQENENINTIADDNKINWKQLAKVNKLKPPYQLSKGDVIKVPDGRKK